MKIGAVKILIVEDEKKPAHTSERDSRKPAS
jgi:hypothetical protein